MTWRPVTSIPLADTDGNPDTAADAGLAAARQHAVSPGISCRAPQPQRSGGDRSPQPLPTTQTFTLTTAGLPNRTYTSIAQARSDGNNARVWGGMHYPSTVEISDAVGEAIANYVNLNSMQRLPAGDEDASCPDEWGRRRRAAGGCRRVPDDYDAKPARTKRELVSRTGIEPASAEALDT